MMEDMCEEHLAHDYISEFFFIHIIVNLEPIEKCHLKKSLFDVL